MTNFILGIDVSKLKLDCHLTEVALQSHKTKTVANTIAGLEILLRTLSTWFLTAIQVRVIVEPTSTYHELVINTLHRAGFAIYLVNPAKLRDYAKSQGSRNKTDALDAAMLARYGEKEIDKLRLWQPAAPAALTLRALNVRRNAIKEDLQRECNRLEKYEATAMTGIVKKSLQKSITFLEEQLIAIDKNIGKHIKSTPTLLAIYTLLQTIPGVGKCVGANMAALFATHEFANAEQAAAFLGLVPVHWQSGTSVKGRPHLSKTGSADLRALLYMSAVSAMRCNPHIKETYNRMLKNGKCKMSALGCAMRKMVHLCYGVVHSGKPYDEHHVSVKVTSTKGTMASLLPT
jgi:transposase